MMALISAVIRVLLVLTLAIALSLPLIPSREIKLVRGVGDLKALIRGNLLSNRLEPASPSDVVYLLYSESTARHLGRRYRREFRTALRVLMRLGFKVRVVKERMLPYAPIGSGAYVLIDNRCMAPLFVSYLEEHLRRGGALIVMYQSGSYSSDYVKLNLYPMRHLLGISSLSFSGESERYRVIVMSESIEPFYSLYREELLPRRFELGRDYGVDVSLAGAQVLGYWEAGGPAVTSYYDNRAIFVGENLLAYENAFNADNLRLMVALLMISRAVPRELAVKVLRHLSGDRFLVDISDYTKPWAYSSEALDRGPEVRVLLNRFNFAALHELVLNLGGEMGLDDGQSLEPGWYVIRIESEVGGYEVTQGILSLSYLSSEDAAEIWRGWRLRLRGKRLTLASIGVPRGKAWRYRTYRFKELVVSVSDGLEMMIALPLEAYVAGVVPLEMPPTWHLEALKAQAVAARTYALRNLGRHREADLCDMPHCQAFGGESAETHRSDEAVVQTAGEVLTYQGELIMAVYHSTCGGRTASAEDVWGIRVPYLSSVSDVDEETGRAFCEASPMYRWERSFAREELRRLFSENLLRLTGRRLRGEVRELRVLRRDVSGRVSSLELITDRAYYVLRGDDIPYLFSEDGYFPGIPSTLIDGFELNEEELRVWGRGWGHGVGMCQWGARGMALRGFSYRDILKHYYKGVKVERNDRKKSTGSYLRSP